MANAKPTSVLVDSNVFIGLLRRGLDPVERLGTLEGATDLATCGMVRLEVLRGLKSPRVRDLIAGFMDVMINVPTTSGLWEDAAAMAWAMDRQGRILPAQDILIAVCASRIGAAVLTDDAHFQDLPGLRILQPSEHLEGW